MDLKYAQVRSQSLRIAHYSLVHGALYSKIRRLACVFMRILEACSEGASPGEARRWNRRICTTGARRCK